MHGFSSLLLGIECKHSLLSRAVSVAVLRATQAQNFIFLFILLKVFFLLKFIATLKEVNSLKFLTHCSFFLVCHILERSAVLAKVKTNELHYTLSADDVSAIVADDIDDLL